MLLSIVRTLTIKKKNHDAALLILIASSKARGNKPAPLSIGLCCCKHRLCIPKRRLKGLCPLTPCREAGKDIGSAVSEVFLQTQRVLVYVLRGLDADVAEMPGLVLDARYVLLIVRVTQYEAETVSVLG